MIENQPNSKELIDHTGRPFQKNSAQPSTMRKVYTFTKGQLATLLTVLSLLAAALGNVDRILTFFFPDPIVTYLSVSPSKLPITGTSLEDFVQSFGLDPLKSREVLIFGGKSARSDENALSIYLAFDVENVGAHEARDVELTVDFALRREHQKSERLIPIKQTFSLGTIPPGKVFCHDVMLSILGEAESLPAVDVQNYFESGYMLALVSATASYVNNLGNRVSSGEFQGEGNAGFLQRVYEEEWGPGKHPSQQNFIGTRPAVSAR